MQHYDVLIVTPGRIMEAQYVKSLSEVLAECDKRRISYKWLNGQGSLVHYARELAISGGDNISENDKGPLHDSVTYGKIFCIDSDIEWSIDDFFTLYESEHDISCGAYLLGDGVTTSVHAWGKIGGIDKKEILRHDKPFKIQSTGLGFIAVKSGVFEKLSRPWFSHFIQPVSNIRDEEVEVVLGEDISWCIKVYHAGIDIWFYPKVLVNHMKTIRVAWK